MSAIYNKGRSTRAPCAAQIPVQALRGAGSQWHRAMVSMLRKRTCILVSMSMPCQI